MWEFFFVQAPRLSVTKSVTQLCALSFPQAFHFHGRPPLRRREHIFVKTAVGKQHTENRMVEASTFIYFREGSLPIRENYASN